MGGVYDDRFLLQRSRCLGGGCGARAPPTGSERSALVEEAEDRDTLRRRRRDVAGAKSRREPRIQPSGLVQRQGPGTRVGEPGRFTSV